MGGNELLHFSRNLNFLNKSFSKLSYLLIIALIIQSFLPLIASASIRSQYLNAALEGVIIICSGNELIYLKQNTNGDYTQIPASDVIPTSAHINHCDGCILPSTALAIANGTAYYIKLIDSAKRPDNGHLPTLTFYNQLPPSRAPPA